MEFLDTLPPFSANFTLNAFVYEHFKSVYKSTLILSESKENFDEFSNQSIIKAIEDTKTLLIEGSQPPTAERSALIDELWRKTMHNFTHVIITLPAILLDQLDANSPRGGQTVPFTEIQYN